MTETYKNVLANKFMRDTNYIIIKDTDDIDELERQWELFNSCLKSSILINLITIIIIIQQAKVIDNTILVGSFIYFKPLTLAIKQVNAIYKEFIPVIFLVNK